MTLPSSGQLGGTPTNVQFQGWIEDLRDVVSNQAGGAGRFELTIASGAVTPPARDHGGVFKIDTEGNAANDILDTITQTNTPDGTIVFLMAEDAARVVTLNHAAGGTGQMLLFGSVDFVFASLLSWIMLQRRGTDWVELLRWVPPEDLTALTVSDDANDLLRVWDDSANADKRIPALQVGRVLQIVHATDAGSSHSNTSYANLNGAGVSITPKSASSKLLIEVSARMRCGNVAAANATATLSIYETVAGTAISSEHVVEAFSAAGGQGVGVPGIIRVRVNSTGVSSRTFGLQGKVNNASSLVTGSIMVWTITEYME